jgi:hypothetical protein
MRIGYPTGIVTKPKGLKGLILSVRKKYRYGNVKAIHVLFEDGLEWTFDNCDFEDIRDPQLYPPGNMVVIGVSRDQLRAANPEMWGKEKAKRR